MKKLFSFGIFVMLFAFGAFAQAPASELKFETTVYDFGVIQETGGLATANFEFSNEGDAPLVINTVSASCGCTTPDWTREPVSSKGKGFIKVSYNPKGRIGPFSKSVTVRSNSSDTPVVLQIKGEVVRETK